MKLSATPLRRSGAFICLLALTAAWPAVASAQAAYKCTRDGSTFYSDRPCATDAKSLVATQPSNGSLPPTPQRSRADPQAYKRYMSPTCRNLGDTVARLQQLAMNADEEAPARHRLEAEATRYNDNCYADERQARERVGLEARDSRDRQRAEQEAERAAQQQLTLSLAQCNEMRRIRDQRRAQLATLSPGERGDFERFEANFASRCTNLAPR
jgi:hypothetical protein